MPLPRFLTLDEVLGMHSRAITTYGGDTGTLNSSSLESAVHAVRNYFEYELNGSRRVSKKGISALAACYWYHLTVNHGFVDGNKRVGYASAKTFLYLNGFTMKIPHDLAEELSIAVASGSLSRDGLMLKIDPYVHHFYGP